MEIYSLGIDVGASKTEVILMSKDELTLNSFKLEGANFQREGIKKIIKIISSVKEIIFKQSTYKNFILTIGIAGVWRDCEREEILKILVKRFKEFLKINVMSDSEIAHYGAFKGQDGILVIAGTGALAIGRENKKWVRAGGYGFILGDIGSAFWIGKKGLESAISSFEGWGKNTLLTHKILNFYKVKNPVEIIPLIYRGDPVLNISKLATLVIEIAKRGDKIAKSIIDEGVKGLTLYARSVYQKLSLFQPEIRTSGGLFAHTFYREKVHISLKNMIKNARIASSEKSPSFGAALYGLRSWF